MPRQTKTTASKTGKSAKRQTKQDSDIHSQGICPACHGKKECPVCGGTKKVKCTHCDGRGKEDCPKCSGGYVTKTRWINCNNCHGTGIVYPDSRGRNMSAPEVNGYIYDPCSCEECDGRGQIIDEYREICPNCHGDYEDFRKCTECNGKKTEDCYTCHGTGELVCPLCEGKDFSTIEEVCEKINEKIGVNGSADFRCDWGGDWGESWIGEFIPVLTDAANHGVGIAMHVLGLFYWGDSPRLSYWGDGPGLNVRTVIPCDKEKAATWFRKAAEHGIADAQWLWGYILEFGYCGVEANLNKAFEWYKAAAEQRQPLALMKVAETYVDGHLHFAGESKFNGEVNHEKALAYFKIIIEESHKHPENWDEDDICYAEKHVELLPQMINGDSNAIDAMYGWILEDWKEERTGSRRSRFEDYWKEMSPARRKQEAESKKYYLVHAKGGRLITRRYKNRWLFILIGIFFGLLGLQFVYARRWKFFFAHWASFVAAIIWTPKVFSFCIALWLGSLFFMKHDGDGRIM